MNPVVFESFYKANYNYILRFIERRIDSDLAADICAECFAIAWRKFDDENTNSIEWLYQTARNLIGNAYRKRDREVEVFRRLRDEPVTTTPDAVDDLLEALTQLNTKYREVLELTYWEELSAAQVGLVLGISEQAAWKRISRAKQALLVIMHDQVAGSTAGSTQ